MYEVRGLREPYPEIIVWIDAVCINQNTEDEKVPQLKILREICKKAKRVIICLTPLEQFSVAALIIASQWIDEKKIN